METINPEECRVGIAIVEDEKALVDVYRRVFARQKIIVCFVAYDGREALRKYAECAPKPHVILMDQRLPGMSGIEVAREMLKLDPDVKIVFLSADVYMKGEAIRAGAIAFLKKPASIRDIIDAIKNARDRQG